MRRSLVGTTYIMDYILEISKAVVDTREKILSFPQIHNIIVQKSIEIQRIKTIDAGKAWRSYDKQAQSKTFLKVAAEKTIRAMVSWGLLEREGNKTYMATRDLFEIGSLVSEKRGIEYKRHIIGNMIRNDPELAFTPSRYLIPIRDFRLPDRLIKGLEYFSSEEAFPRTRSHVKSTLKINMVDFDIMSTWGQFFNFTNEFNPKILDEEATKQIYLTCWVASVAELDSTFRMISKNGEVAEPPNKKVITERGFEHGKAILKELDWVRLDEIRQKHKRAKTATPTGRTSILRTLMDQNKETDAIIVSEGDTTRGIGVREDLNPTKVYVILPRKISDPQFKASMVKYYQHLKKRFGSPYIWISQLRTMCCRELRIQDQVFDEFLTQAYSKQPDEFEFSMIGGDASRGRTRSFGKPFRLYDQIFRIIRLEDKLLE